MGDEYKPVQFDVPGPADFRLQVMGGGPRSSSRKPSGESYEERHKRAIEEHLSSSLTRKTIDFIFLSALGILFVNTVIGWFGLGGKITALTWLYYAALCPFLRWQPDPSQFALGPLRLDIKTVVAMCVYGVVYYGLRTAHRRVTEERTYIPHEN